MSLATRGNKMSTPDPPSFNPTPISETEQVTEPSLTNTETASVTVEANLLQVQKAASSVTATSSSDTDTLLPESEDSASERDETTLLMETDTQDSGTSGAAKMLDQLQVKQKRLTTAERKRILKAKLAEQGIPWDPKKFAPNRNRYKRKADSNMSEPTPSAGSGKRGRAESATPPSAEKARKKPRQQRAGGETSSKPTTSSTATTFKDALTSTKVAIVPNDYPKTRLTEAQANSVEGMLMRRMEKTEPLEDGTYPSFDGIFTERGALIIACNDKASQDWLIAVTSELEPLEGNVKLVAGDRKELMRATKVLVRVPGMRANTTPELIRTVLDKQNPALRVSEWKLISSKEDNKGWTLVYLVYDEVLPSIRAAGGKANVYFQKAALHILPNKEKKCNDLQSATSQSSPQ